jgi:two-component SAPR family response regulator
VFATLRTAWDGRLARALGELVSGVRLVLQPDQLRSRSTRRALALWRGESLEGSDYLWADGEICSLRATRLDLLERVGRVRLARGDVRGALQMAEQGIALDRLHEPSWRLRAPSRTLARAARIDHPPLRRARARSRREPARETRMIYRQLLGQA